MDLFDALARRNASGNEDELRQRIAELERQLAETEQYLAVVEGQADGGPPGWTMVNSDDPYEDRWDKGGPWQSSPQGTVSREEAAGTWYWKVWDADQEYGSGLLPTAREAMAAAEAAYQEAMANG